MAKQAEAADWLEKINTELVPVVVAKVTYCSLLPVSIHKSVTVNTKDQNAI